MSVFFKSRKAIACLPAICLLAVAVHSSMDTDLKITPKYDDSSVEVALIDLDELLPPPPEPEPEPEQVAELPPPEEEVVEAVEIAPPPPPKPKPPAPRPPPPKPKPQVVKAVPTPPRPQPVLQAPTPAPATAPPVAPARPIAQAPRANPADLESRYIARLLAELEKYKQYPRGREASLQRPKAMWWCGCWLTVAARCSTRALKRRRPICCSIAPHKPACNASIKLCPSPRKVSRARINTVSAPRLYTTQSHN